MFRTGMDVNNEVPYGTAPSVLVVSDCPLASKLIEDALQCVHARLIDFVRLADLAERLDRTVSVSAIVVHASSETPGQQLEDVIFQLNAAAHEGTGRAIVIVPPSLIDIAYGAISHPDVELLIQPDQAEIVATLAMVCTRRPMRLNDVSSVADGTRLVQLSEEIGRIARTLATLAENAPPRSVMEPAEFGAPPPLTADVSAAAGAKVRAMIRARRTRDQFFRPDLFADPAWDMLLDLMAARLEHKRVSVSSLCIAASVPATTALRWIKSMTDEGLLVRRADNMDGRRIFIELSERAAGAMTAYLDWLKVNPAVVV